MRIAVFPGSFDPFTIAHQDLINRALPLFDKIYIAIGINSSKVGMMDVESRKLSISELFADNEQVEVSFYNGLTVDYCLSIGAQFILRGLRNGTDLDYENIIAQNNLLLAPQIETYFLVSRSGEAHISSTIVRDIWKNNGDINHLVPATILKHIKKSN
ncbi:MULTISPECIES: pantetheine-phosphate adenylyltransferase [Sphingobacterium]|uniref:pantetheine-phosphate adenylyltransferase n=1 Tax=Sphingobacterium TaxID=28453 RepID=UPI000B93D777|nr:MULTISPECIES: pantetheine-phosphate adenylyltransferase [Sphingobacterium]OYD42590.1 pantetheine-phosphate adenylyltransferase [Sphingobacterium cellulitidis]OYD45201.1 pantetheine-phosphate adenylyltransferase [Sphingobacterium cellulitidis]WFB61907.1 pantetheine-phosphate adenylyltransferase [Sphingobacterium sp. WM]